jgi:hypothetical protein
VMGAGDQPPLPVAGLPVRVVRWGAVDGDARVGARICWVLSKFKGLRQTAIFLNPV